MIPISGLELMPIVRAALERGQTVRMTAHGGSMLPFIYDGETVELVPPRPSWRLGDIVLAQSAAERYVLHRIVKIAGESAFLRGDSQNYYEGPFPPQAILGRAVTAAGQGRLRRLDRGVWHWAGLLWLHSGWLGFYLLQLVLGLRRLGRAIPRRWSSSKKSLPAKPCLKS